MGMIARRMTVALLALLLTAAPAEMEGQEAIKPSAPLTVAPPTWSRALTLPDGRTFVTDGGLSVDVKYAKPASLPTTVLPPESGKMLADRMAIPHDNEIGLGDLRAGSRPNSFTTPDGIALNGNYVTLLREALPARQTRLRTRGKADAVVVVVNGQPVAILMPLAPAR